MANDPLEVNKLELGFLEPHVADAVNAEHERFMKELRTFGPQVISISGYKPRLRAAAEIAKLTGPPQNSDAET